MSDPPFGGRMELLAHNMKRIEQDWRTARHLDPQEQLPGWDAMPLCNGISLDIKILKNK